MKKDSNTQANFVSTGTPPSFIKLAMKNMVRKGKQSVFHFGLTAFGFISFILLLASISRPNIPQ